MSIPQQVKPCYAGVSPKPPAFHPTRAPSHFPGGKTSVEDEDLPMESSLDTGKTPPEPAPVHGAQYLSPQRWQLLPRLGSGLFSGQCQTLIWFLLLSILYRAVGFYIFPFEFLCEMLGCQDLLLPSPISWKFLKCLNNILAAVERNEGKVHCEQRNPIIILA